MKNLIITLSFFLLLPLTGHANGLMKFKKVKQGEVAPKIQNRVSYEYALAMRNAFVKFLIKLEEDTNAGKVTRSQSQKIIESLSNNLFIADAYAAATPGRLPTDAPCFVGGWKSKINSEGTCQSDQRAKSGCPKNELKCNNELFGENTCVQKDLNNFTKNCVAASAGKIEEITTALRNQPNKIQDLSEEIEGFCTAWNTVKQRLYPGCTELKKRVADIQTKDSELTAKNEADLERQRQENLARMQRLAEEEQQQTQQPLEQAQDERQVSTTEPTTSGGEETSNGGNQARTVVDPQSSAPARTSKLGNLKIINGGEQQAGESSSDLYCKKDIIPPPDGEEPSSCVKYLTNDKTENEIDFEMVQESVPATPTAAATTRSFRVYAPIRDDGIINFESPEIMARYLGLQSFGSPIVDKINIVKACRLIASGCPTRNVSRGSYWRCIEQSEEQNKRVVEIGLQKTIAIVKAAEATTQFNPEDNYGGTPIQCKGNANTRDTRGGFAFDFPRCKAFVNWFTVLGASEIGFKVGNEAAVTTAGMRNQTRLTQQIQEGNGQDAGLEAARLQSVEAKKAEERNMAFFSAKAAAIGAQLAQWVGPGNVCKDPCCKLFDAQGADKIGTNYFPNQDGKQHIIAQLVKAGADIAVAKLKADMHAQNARKVEAVKEQMQFTDDSEEGVMKFCVQFPQDVRCLSPGQRRALGASGTQFGSFQGSNFGLGSLEGEQGNEVSAGQDFGGSLAAGGPSGNVGNIGSADKDAAAAKNIFNAPAPARGGGGGGGGAGAGGGGGGGGGSAQAGQLSRDEGLKEDKKESPIEITSKKAAYEGSKGGYNGGGYNPSNKKPGESPTANPFAGMFGKDQGRDPANVAEIDKPASDLFSKISRRYGEVQKRKALMEVADEGNGIR